MDGTAWVGLTTAGASSPRVEALLLHPSSFGQGQGRNFSGRMTTWIHISCPVIPSSCSSPCKGSKPKLVTLLLKWWQWKLLIFMWLQSNLTAFVWRRGTRISTKTILLNSSIVTLPGAEGDLGFELPVLVLLTEGRSSCWWTRERKNREKRDLCFYNF